MTPEKWTELIGTIKDSFPVVREGREDLDPVGTADFIEFNGPAGHTRLEFIRKPVQLGVRGLGSNRIGSSVQLEAEYSDEEEIHTLKAYRRGDNGEWLEMKKTDQLSF